MLELIGAKITVLFRAVRYRPILRKYGASEYGAPSSCVRSSGFFPERRTSSVKGSYRVRGLNRAHITISHQGCEKTMLTHISTFNIDNYLDKNLK